MGVRPFADFPRNEPGLVDRFLGTAYDVVKEVYDNLDAFKDLHEVLGQIEDLAAVKVEEAMVPARIELQGYLDQALAAQQAAEDARDIAVAAANRANTINKVYMFPFVAGQDTYDVTAISGDPTLTTASMTMWVEGALEYDFTVLDATTFKVNTPDAYAAGAQMGIIVNAHFDDVANPLLVQLQELRDEVNALKGNP